MDNKKKFENNIPDAPNEKQYKISFEKRKTKANIRLGTKLVVYLILAGISGAFFSQQMIKWKYGKVIQQFEGTVTNDMIINDYSEIINKVSPSIVTLSNSNDSIEASDVSTNTTGVVLDKMGNILTNYATIKNYEEIYVKLPSAKSEPIKGKVVLKNLDIDIAIIKIDYDEELVPIKFADANSIRKGQGIAVLGNAIGDDSIGNITPGIVTTRYEDKSVDKKRYSLIQVSAPINKENTGGPIVNSKGELIGLASSELSNKYKEDGLYLGIELRELELIVSSTNALKNILGVSEGGILADKSQEFKGFYVQQVDKSGNAYKAGIKPTDIILEIDEHKVISVEELILVLENKKNGDTLKCKVLSDGEIKEVQIKINN